MIWLLPTPVPNDTQGTEKEGQLADGRGVQGRGGEPNHTTAKNPGTINTLLGELTIVSKTYYNTKRIMDLFPRKAAQDCGAQIETSSHIHSDTTTPESPYLYHQLVHTQSQIFIMGLSLSFSFSYYC
jgi:hypothetical protein